MFKSILYRLIFFTALLILSVAMFTYCITIGEYIYSLIPGLLVFESLNAMYYHYKKYDENILFLLNALDNGDYSFYFTENKTSRRERELNNMLNRIRVILTNARKEVIENEKFLSLIVESVSSGIVIYDDKGNVNTVNQAAKELLGLQVFTHLSQLRYIDDNYPKLFKELQAGDNIQIKLINEREEIQISLNVSDIKLNRGLMKVIIFNNIENELEAKEIESWIRLIRVMTHEIMNSIAPITSLTETLLYSHKENSQNNDTLNRNTIEALETINTTAKGLLSFVESYRRFTGVPKPQRNQFELVSLLGKVSHLESYRFVEKNISFEIVAPSEVMLFADETQITQVLMNLIKNAEEAIEAEGEGKILIKVIDNQDRIQIDICNNGKPIPAEVVPHIFIPFFTTRESGTGIGLSISRYIMRLHGGNLKHHTKDNWTIFSMVF
ncbi:PAS domain-containing protein [Dysgonomonas sp. 521]|uniref:sensor histidine kinase n=1 Tax=Dysgonomonas sp. 521 TaxID=2302932 RepID=UPI0013D5A837|nr:ATP-binding protein [Dysgonomonas sp. 521]NDV93892.1 PAS domain-containing protein [Dysgonomonas sp. 521]